MAKSKSRLIEKTRQELIAKSKAGTNYSSKNQFRGKNRWERRRYSQMANSVASYNKISMDDFFKKDELKFSIEVNGETDRYLVTIRYSGALREIASQIKQNKNKLEFKVILVSLTRMFNAGNIYVSCTCPDYKYRFAYVATKDDYNSGIPELRPADITNPDDRLGAGCKHINLVLANVDWLYKVSSVVNNYINYCKDNMENNYARYIFPKLYGMDYDKAIQMSVFDYDDQGNVVDTMASDEETINLANAIGKRRGIFRTGNQYRFQKKPQPTEEDENKLELNIVETPAARNNGANNTPEENEEKDSNVNKIGL